MPFPGRLAAQRRVRLHRGPKKGRLPIRTLPAFPARLLEATRTTLLLGPHPKPTLRTLDPRPSCSCDPGTTSWDRLATGLGTLRMPKPDVRSPVLDTGRSGDVS